VPNGQFGIRPIIFTHTYIFLFFIALKDTGLLAETLHMTPPPSAASPSRDHGGMMSNQLATPAESIAASFHTPSPNGDTGQFFVPGGTLSVENVSYPNII
jgi:hypothetical protein